MIEISKKPGTYDAELVVVPIGDDWPDEWIEYNYLALKPNVMGKKDGEGVVVHESGRSLLFMNVLTATKKSFRPLINTIKKMKPTTTQILDHNNFDVEEFTTQLITSCYEYGKTTEIPNIEILQSRPYDAKIESGVALGNGINFTKELGNTPPNTCTPVWLAEQAVLMADQYEAATCEIFTEDYMEELGAGAFISVSKGSTEPGRFIVIEFLNGPDISKDPIILIGKGVTFDSGGISLKPGGKMHEMKYDMLGAGTVMGVMKTIMEQDVKENIVMIVAAVENMPAGNATKPGDVVTNLSGKTIEVQNTDAEGRMVLCDAISYAQDKYTPRYIIDVATLTGAIVTALGSHATGLFSNSDSLVNDITVHAEQTGDKVWRMPIWSEYDKQLKSSVADVCNIGTPGAGSSTAACFLNRFVEDGVKWAHLDIAGTAWNGDNATGACVRLLTSLVSESSN